MKTSLIFVILLSVGTATAQTGLIAHKSHSGTAASYLLAHPGNFGLPPVRLQKVTWVNDTTVVATKGRLSQEIEKDTLYNHPLYSAPNVSVDSLKQLYNGGVEFENFDKKEIKTPPKQEINTQPSNNAPATEKQPKATKSRKKSSAFWLWLVGGGTFTGILLISRRRKPGAAHA